MRIPWKFKSAAFAAFDILGPRPLYLAQRYVTGRSLPAWNAPRPNWIFHRDQIRKHEARRILEFGAGKSVAQNLYLFTQLPDIEQTVVDIAPMIDLTLVNIAIDRLESLGFPVKGRVSSLDELSRTYRISYMAPVDMRRTSFEAGSFDACISTNTLEHIPAETIPDIWRECRRILAPGGMVSAKIDYSDHYAGTDARIGHLNYLSFTSREWTRHNHASHHQNRLRHRHHVDLMKAAGLLIDYERAGSPHQPPRVVHEENVTGDPTDFCLWGRIVARSPG